MGFTPFWAVIGHEQVMAIERQPELFANEPNSMLGRAADIERQRQPGGIIRSLVQMDAPDHPKDRKSRTAQADTEVAGVSIKKGDWLYLVLPRGQP